MTKQQHIITKQIQKHDIEANWLKAINFIPEKGRLIIYDTEVDAEGNTLELPENRTTPYIYERFKIGDGIHNVNELPFVNDFKNISDGKGNGALEQSHDTETWTGIDAEGNEANYNTEASGKFSTIYGGKSYAEGGRSLSGGTKSVAKGSGSLAFGDTNYAGDYATAFGYQTRALGAYSHTEGRQTVTEESNAHAEGSYTKAKGNSSHAEGSETIAEGLGSHAEGVSTKANGGYSHAEGQSTIADGFGSHAEGKFSEANGGHSHAEGQAVYANGNNSHAEGSHTQANGENSHAEGALSYANGENSHAEGDNTIADGNASHAEGTNTKASQDEAHAEGWETEASGHHSHSEGQQTKAIGDNSHAGGRGTIAAGEAQTAIGRYNVENTNALFIVGNGDNNENRNNAFVVNVDGTATIQVSGTNDDNIVNYRGLKDYVAANSGSDINLEDLNKSIRIHNKDAEDYCDWSEPNITIGNDYAYWCNGYTEPRQQLYMSYDIVELKDDNAVKNSRLTPGALEFTNFYSGVTLNFDGITYNGSIKYWRDIINSSSGGGSNPYENSDSKVYINIAEDNPCSGAYDLSPEIKLQNRYDGYTYKQQLSIQPEEIYSYNGDMYEYKLNYDGIMIHNGKNDCGMNNLRVLDINLNGISYDGYYYENGCSQVRYSKTVTWKELLSGGGNSFDDDYGNIYINNNTSYPYISVYKPGYGRTNHSYDGITVASGEKTAQYSKSSLSYYSGNYSCGQDGVKFNLSADGISRHTRDAYDYDGTTEKTESMTWDRIIAAVKKIESLVDVSTNGQ